jgi:hypothetical protein
MDQLSPRPDNLVGMDAAGAQEYIYQYAVTLNLTKQKLRTVEGELAKWKGRLELSGSRGEEVLSREAEKEVRRCEAERDTLAGEIRDLTGELERLRRSVPGLAARERTVDPDILEQELLLAAGNIPGEDAAGGRKTDGELKQLRADAALEALKEKMRQNGSL